MFINNSYSRRLMLQQLAAAGLLTAVGAKTVKAQEPKRRVCITIDDGPVVGANNDLDMFLRVANGIREAFVAEKVPAIMFINEVQMNIDGQRDDRARVLDAWLKSGLELGNHTYSHRDLKKVELWEYYDEIVKGEVITRPLLKKAGQELKWFRYPFLSTDKGDRAAQVEAFLKQRNYSIAPVTVDYSDYSFASGYSRALRSGDQEQAASIVRTVITALDAAFEKSEKISQDLLGHEIPLVLLIHCNELNARNLPEFLARMRGRGYEFISLDNAMEDLVYHTPNLPPGTMGGAFFAGLAQAIGTKKEPAKP